MADVSLTDGISTELEAALSDLLTLGLPAEIRAILADLLDALVNGVAGRDPGDVPTQDEAVAYIGFVAELLVESDPLDGFVDEVVCRLEDLGLIPVGFVDTTIGTADRDVLMGTDASDLIHGKRGNDRIEGKDGDDLLIGGEGNDNLFGGDDHDILTDGAGNDKMNGGDGKDILLFMGGENDRGVGGDDGDLFALDPVFFANGTKDRVKIADYNPHEDLIDIGPGVISEIRELNKEVHITFEGDGDMLIVRGTNDFDDIVFTSFPIVLPDPDDGDEDGDHGDGGDGGDAPDGPMDGVTLISPDDGTNLNGTDFDDVFIFKGGVTGRARGNEGADMFQLTESLLGNGIVDKVQIKDFMPGEDVVDVLGADINSVKELNNRVQVFVGPDDDLIEFVGLNTFDLGYFGIDIT